jgi:cardiolipin synthase
MKRFYSDLLNVPNIMSLFRIALTPVLYMIWVGLDWKALGLALGTVIGISDQLDGWVARKLNQTTKLGELLDQLGDLLFESTALLIGVLTGYLWSGVLVIYLHREFVVSVVRTFVIGNGGTLPSSILGKAKSSCIQWAFFPLFLGSILLDPGVLPDSRNLAGVAPGQFLIVLANASIAVGLVLGYISAYAYLKEFIHFYSGFSSKK